MARIVLPRTGPGVEAPAFLRTVLFLDMLAGLGLVVAGVVAAADGWFPRVAWAAWALLGYGVLLLVTDVLSARLVPRALTWRRRLGYLAIGAIVWKDGPFEVRDRPVIAVLVILWCGLVWIALVTGGRTLSRAIATATGEDKPS